MRLVLKADRLIDGTGADPVENAAVVVESGRITEVTTQDRIQTGPHFQSSFDTYALAKGSLTPL